MPDSYGITGTALALLLHLHEGLEAINELNRPVSFVIVLCAICCKIENVIAIQT
jgi:hypothetical protein